MCLNWPCAAGDDPDDEARRLPQPRRLEVRVQPARSEEEPCPPPATRKVTAVQADLDAVRKSASLYGMDETKLTIRIERATLERAKRYARAHGTSLTRLVTSHLERLGAAGEAAGDEAPVTRRLTGVLPPEASLHDYHEHIERTHA